MADFPCVPRVFPGRLYYIVRQYENMAQPTPPPPIDRPPNASDLEWGTHVNKWLQAAIQAVEVNCQAGKIACRVQVFQVGRPDPVLVVDVDKHGLLRVRPWGPPTYIEGDSVLHQGTPGTIKAVRWREQIAEWRYNVDVAGGNWGNSPEEDLEPNWIRK